MPFSAGWTCSADHVECCGFTRKTPMDWCVLTKHTHTRPLTSI